MAALVTGRANQLKIHPLEMTRMVVRLMIRVAQFVAMSVVIVTITSTSAGAADNKVSFNRDIRPILSDKC